MIMTISCLFCPDLNSFNFEEGTRPILNCKCTQCGTEYSFSYPSNQLNWIMYHQKSKTIRYSLLIDYKLKTTSLVRYQVDINSNSKGKMIVSLETALPPIDPKELPKFIKRLKKIKAFA